MVDSREQATRSGRFDSKETQNALNAAEGRRKQQRFAVSASFCVFCAFCVSLVFLVQHEIQT
jgi:hypothetical protein